MTRPGTVVEFTMTLGGEEAKETRDLPDGTWIEYEADRWDDDLEAALVAWEKAVLWTAYAEGFRPDGLDTQSEDYKDRRYAEAIEARREFVEMLWNYHGEFTRRTWMRPGEDRKMRRER